MSSFQTFSERGLKAGAVVGANRAGSLQKIWRQKCRADQLVVQNTGGPQSQWLVPIEQAASKRAGRTRLDQLVAQNIGVTTSKEPVLPI